MADFKYEDVKIKYAVATVYPYPKKKTYEEEPYNVVALFANLDDACKFLDGKNSDHYKIWIVFDGKISFVLKSLEVADEYSLQEPPEINSPCKEE